MAAFAELKAGCTFRVPADDDHVIYGLLDDGSVESDGMITMTPDEAREAFADADLFVTSELR